MKFVSYGILLWIPVVSAIREPSVTLRATNPQLTLEKVLDGKNLTAVVVGATELTNNTIQVVLEANITPPAPPLVPENHSVTENKTSVMVIYSAHNPKSVSLIRDGLLPLFTRPDIINVTSLQLVPFGKAVEVKIETLSTGFLYWHPELQKANISAVYRCPNGEGECESSLIHACAIKVSENDPLVYVPFIACMSTSKPGTAPEDASFACSNSTIFMESLRTCALGSTGVRLQHELANIAAHATDVPFVSINGKVFNVSDPSFEFPKLFCDTLFADGRMDRDRCQGKRDAIVVAPFQSILPSQSVVTSVTAKS